MAASKQNLKKMPLEKKPALKGRTVPPVRQTLTSYKRMHIANPLLKYQEAGIDVDEIIAQKSSSNTLRSLLTIELKISRTLDKSTSNAIRKPSGKPLVRTQSLKIPKSINGTSSGFKRTTNMPGSQHINNYNIKNTTINNSNALSNITKPKQETLSKYVPIKSENRKTLVEIKAKVNSFPQGTSKAKPKHYIKQKGSQSTLRRSLSSDQLQLKSRHSSQPAAAFNKMNHSQSDEQLAVPVSAGFKEFSPIMEENRIDRNFVFRTPSAYDRRSICHHTPHSVRQSNLFRASTPAPIQMQKLQERLNRWLISRGKPPASFHHLRVFDSSRIKQATQEIIFDTENKENIEVNNISESYENLKIVTTSPEKEREDVELRTQMSEEELAKNAKEAMAELLKLIGEDYPRDQCLGWLELIRDKYRKIDEEPEYWECRAAIEQSAGNVHNAVEFYKTAIIQGAEVNSVDKSLDQLLKKFSLLSISPSKAQQKGNHLSDKERIVREARNVFKSSIIQFAIRERNIKKSSDNNRSAQASSKKLVAIPVRRSTRLSRSGYTNTSGLKLCTSLKELSPSEDISFEKNKALC